MAPTNIEWADRVWNPVTGCTKVSQGCKNCYAEGVANRFFATQYPAIVTSSVHTRPRRFTDVQTHGDRLHEPLKWRKPSRVFVNSMSDLFHKDVPDAFIGRVFDVMATAQRQTFLILTKRPARMRELLPTMAARHTAPNRTGWPLPNVHVGVSVENQQTADERIPELLKTPAAIRWVSYEPALGPVDFDAPHCENCAREHEQIVPPQDGAGAWCVECDSEACFGWWLGGDPGLDWIVVGGESGHGARPFDVAWARQTVEQCKAAGVPVFVKQLGAVVQAESVDDVADLGWRAPDAVEAGTAPLPFIGSLRNRKGGDMSEWPEDLRVRELPEVRA